jgi:hypothetical protein
VMTFWVIIFSALSTCVTLNQVSEANVFKPSPF